MKINKDRFITVMKIVNGKPIPASVKLFYQSDLLILREATNQFKYSICLNKGCKPVLMSLNNKKIGMKLCKYADKAFITKSLSGNKAYFRYLLNICCTGYIFNYKNWSSHI